MRTIKNLLKKLDIDRLVNAYVYEYPFDYFVMQKEYVKMTLGEIKNKYKANVKKVINRLKDMEVMKVPNDEKMVMFAYRNISDVFGDKDILFAACKINELKKKKNKASTYAFNFTKQEEIIGFYVAETELTKKNIYELLAYVLHELTFFGWNQEYLEKEEKKLIEASEDARNGKGLRKFDIEKWNKKLGIIKETEEEEELHQKINMMMYKYSQCSKKKEIGEVLEIILN